jgi:hypothetical protein
MWITGFLAGETLSSSGIFQITWKSQLRQFNLVKNVPLSSPCYSSKRKDYLAELISKTGYAFMQRRDRR